MNLGAIIGLLPQVLPGAIDLAEKLFKKRKPEEKRGFEKKEFVMQTCGMVFDNFLKQALPDSPHVDEKALFLDLCSGFIDKIVEAKKAA